MWRQGALHIILKMQPLSDSRVNSQGPDLTCMHNRTCCLMDESKQQNMLTEEGCGGKNGNNDCAGEAGLCLRTG